MRDQCITACVPALATGECEVGLPPIPSNFGGSFSSPGLQIIAEGLSFNRSASIKSIHLGGVCSLGRCFGEFQVWRPVNQSAFSLLHTYLVTVQPTAATYFSTSVPIRGSPLSVESGDVVGFLGPNTDPRSEGIGIATSTTSDTRYTLFEFNTVIETVVIDAAALIRTQAIPLISAEGTCQCTKSPTIGFHYYDYVQSYTYVDDCTRSTSVQTPLSIPPDPPSPPVENTDPPGPPVGAIGGAVGAVVVVVLVLILLSVVVAVCAAKKRRKNRLGKAHIHDPPTIGEYMYAVCSERSAVGQKLPALF